MEKLKMQTADMAERNVELLGQMFPNCLTETINADGKLVRAIDFDKLRQELACEVVEGAEERYQFTWPDKRAAIRLANAPTNKTLRPCREESVDFDNTENLYIEGDNLEVLKLLRENYLGKVKMIYIDPPYNTGNDFVYNDDFAQGKAEFEAQSGLFDEEGRRMADPMVQNTESNGRFHTDWLNMIYPRLKVAKDLLSDDGIIFISIDDNEQHNLKKICDEVFGSTNFITCVTRATGTPTGGGFDGMVNELDYMLVYAKNSHYTIINGLPMSEEDAKIYDQQDEKGRYLIRPLRRTGGEDRREDRPTMFFPITAPDGTLVYPMGPTGYESRWICSPETVSRMQAEGMLAWKKVARNGEEQWQVYQKFYLENRTKAAGNLWHNIEGNKKATRDIRTTFDGQKVFDFPKPLGVIIKTLLIGTSKDSIILDFFSGSATTAHAVMQLNAEDGGNRRFIMVQWPEVTNEDSEAYKAGYKNICEIGKERIRRAGKKVKEEAGLHAQNLDIGFRVLKLDESNMADVYYTPADTPIQTTLAFDALVDNIREGRTAEDLLFQVLPECNLPLSSKIEIREIHGKKVFVVEDGYLMACFDNDINEAVITAIAKEKPYYFVMCDRSIATDNVADNFDQIFNAYSKETVRRIL
ncbi:MAG: site-specific DNA-methyltransferase [Alistipes sp.]|nr:site-specific DNA-methyltransferase [Alistipes sp.]